MSDLISLLNNLLATWISGQMASQPAAAAEAKGLHLQEVKLHGQGALLQGTLNQGGWQGEFLLRVEAEPPREGRHTLRFVVERWPQHIPAGLAPFRKMLETARLSLDFSATPEGKPVPEKEV